MEPTLGISRDVLGSSEIGLVPRLQARDPAPGQGVRGGVAVQEMAQKKISPQLPGQLKGENPNAGEPQSRVIVKVSGLDELLGPGIETLDSRPTSGRFLPAATQIAVMLKFGNRRVDPR